MPSAEPVLVVGCGSIGQRHLRNLRALGVRDVVACEPDAGRRAAAEASGARAFADLDEALAQGPGAVLVCTPPRLHVPQALAALRAGAHVFLEKPVSHTLEGLDALEREAAARGAVVQVGYMMRYHPGFLWLRDLVASGRLGRIQWVRAEMGFYLPDWRPGSDHRASYTAQRGQGGGILLDGSHELDYLLALLGPVREVTCVAGRLGDLGIDAEDTASVLLRFRSGAVGEVHLDMVNREKTRRCTASGTAGTATWDYIGGALSLNIPGAASERTPLAVDPNAMYLAELQAFLECAAKDTAARPGLEDGRRALELALAAHASNEQGRTIQV